ncbi:conserved hypothetical protein [Ricinus communis]|uniref:Uncharacterized protein n=1 Tax=Ricinus communis TaxID=3988 RepID=B9R9T9_RICCO|nr:conserved hypothetical protein [Ricinus communis]
MALKEFLFTCTALFVVLILLTSQAATCSRKLGHSSSGHFLNNGESRVKLLENKVGGGAGAVRPDDPWKGNY